MKVRLFTAVLLTAFFAASAQDDTTLGTPEATQFYKEGSDLLKKEQYAEAKVKFNQALAINRQNPEYHYARGLAHYHLGKNFSAINDLQRAINLDANQSNYYYYLGVIHHELEEYKQSNEYLTVALEKNPDSYLKVSDANVRFHIGVNFIEMEDYESAHDIFGNILQENPQNVSALINRGIAAGFLERYDEACSDFTQASELGNSNAAGYMKKYCGKGVNVITNP